MSEYLKSKTSTSGNLLPSLSMIKYLILAISISFVIFSCKTVEPEKTTPIPNTSIKNKAAIDLYRASYTKYFKLIHTALELKPNWKLEELYGTATITLCPYFYPADSLTLNARGMEIHSVDMVTNETNTPLRFNHQNNLLNINLNNTYTSSDTITVIVKYTSRPGSLPPGGSAAIKKDKGLYFINADGNDPYKPRQLWTQGETESNSVWFPTIEDPGQRMTQEIYLTVDTGLKTLSNGLHLSSINNGDGTRTDYWRQSFALPPYLSMIAVGDFVVVNDQWRDIQVNYYIDKDYGKYALMIFGNTPEMIEYFSHILGTDFVWEKYSQIVVHDFVSGAMENNTAVVHGTNMLQDPREHFDYNYEDIISHELFHHWFGNLVTCESWSNVTLNEGFASYGEYLWREHKYGRENADEFGLQDQNIYLRSTKKNDAPLIRFQYTDREDVYDAISYQKGARVLHMLRKLVGDDVFFTVLKNYLQKYKFSSVEYNQLRLEFESLSGQDLNWFFNQWFLKSGKPSLEISKSWNEDKKELTLKLQQIQDLKKNPVYRLPIDVDFYFENQTLNKRIILDSLNQSYIIRFAEKPKLVNVDAEKMLLLEKKVDNKSTEEWIYQYKYAPLFMDRVEAIEALGRDYKINTPAASTILNSLKDKNAGIRQLGLKYIKEIAMNDPESIKENLIKMAQSDSNSFVRTDAFDALGKYYPYKEISSILERSIPDFSYYVEATVFEIISTKDSQLALKLADILERDSSGIVLSELAAFYSEHTDLDKLDFFRRVLIFSSTWTQYRIINYFTTWLKPQNLPTIREGTEILLRIGLSSNNKHILNNCAASLIQLKSELAERSKLIKKSQILMPDKSGNGNTVHAEDVDLIQIESLSTDIETKIKTLEKE